MMSEEKSNEIATTTTISAVKGPNELMLCQTHAYVKKINVVVISCDEHVATTNTKKKKGKKRVKKMYKVRLSDTVLFPEGGGQPADRGTIDGRDVKHVFRDDRGIVYHVVEDRFEVNKVVEVVLDFTFRFDNMQHHTGQHLISALALKMYGWKTLSWSLSPDTVAIQMDSKKEDWTTRASKLEAVVNEKIRSNVKVFGKEYTIEQLQADATMRASSKKFPDGITKLRIVSIGDIDSNPCCGTHVKELSHLQLIKFTGVTNRKGNSILTFCAGDRVIRAMQASLVRELQLTNALNCGPDLFEERVTSIQKDLRTSEKKLKQLSARVAESEAKRIIETARKSEINFVSSHYNDTDMSGLLQIVSLVEKHDTPPVTFFATMCEKDNPKGPGNFIVIGDAEIIKNVGSKVADSMSGRGGGRKGRFQGKVKKLECASNAIEIIEEHLKSLSVGE